MARPTPTRPAANPTPPRSATLMSTAQYLVFEPGLYSVDVFGDPAASTDMGLALPCIRIEPAPPTPSRPGHAAVIDADQGGWLWRRDDPAFVLVVGGRAGAIMTIYRANDGMAAPEIRIRHIQTTAGPPTPVAALPDAADPAPRDAVPMTTLAHLTQIGDVAGAEGGWVGRPGGGAPIEGFAITPDAPLEREDIEYQGILGNNWSTPWFPGGEFCGSRGLMLPMLGIAVRLRGEAATVYECSYQGRFVGGQSSGPCRDGEACQAGSVALEAFQLVIRRRGATAGGPAAVQTETGQTGPARPETAARPGRAESPNAESPKTGSAAPRPRKPRRMVEGL